MGGGGVRLRGPDAGSAGAEPLDMVETRVVIDTEHCGSRV